MSAATENLYQAQRKYEIATAKYWDQRKLGTIRALEPGDPDESAALAAGAKFIATDPTARMVLGIWQKCKSDLDHWAGYVAREKGKTGCVTCDVPVPMGEVPHDFPLDPRLPPERDDDAAVFP